MQPGKPRRIPPWRRRDAEPGPISAIVLISFGVLIVIGVVMFIGHWR